MRIAARSDQGKVRDNNEDCLAFDARLGIAVLADGMGGLRAGEVASATAVEAVMQHLVENTDRLGTDDVGEMLREALELANRRVYSLADSRREFSGMGTRSSSAR
jgi:protein phosphatase